MKSGSHATLTDWVRQAKDDIQSLHDFNAVMMPQFLFLARDPETTTLHLVWIKALPGAVSPTARETWLDKSKASWSWAAIVDVVWIFDPLTGYWHNIKDRTGLFSPLSPIKHQNKRQ